MLQIITSHSSKVFIFSLLITGASLAQDQQAIKLQAPASCLHGTGFSYLLDAYLASVGACNCEKEGVLLYGMPECGNENYSLELDEEFNGTGIDSALWQIQDFAQGATAGGQNMEYNSMDNVELQNGICRLVAKKETLLRKCVDWKDSNEVLADGVKNLRTYHYSSANIWSKKKYFHGKYEIRCRMPEGNGFWPAFWMYGGKQWNEIDVFDNYAGPKKLVHSIGHDHDGTGKSNGCNKDILGYDFTQWHTFTSVFDFDKIALFVDGKLEHLIHRLVTASGQPVNCGDEIATGTYYVLKAFPMEPMQIVFNLALVSPEGPGGSVPVDDTTPFPSAFEVDYIRYWRRVPDEVRLSLSPNPCSHQITISSNVLMKRVEIYNAGGELVIDGECYAEAKQMDVSKLPPGIYFCRITHEGGLKSGKFVKVEE